MAIGGRSCLAAGFPTGRFLGATARYYHTALTSMIQQMAKGWMAWGLTLLVKSMSAVEDNDD